MKSPLGKRPSAKQELSNAIYQDDRRPETQAAEQLQAAIDASPRVTQMMQLQSRFDGNAQAFPNGMVVQAKFDEDTSGLEEGLKGHKRKSIRDHAQAVFNRMKRSKTTYTIGDVLSSILEEAESDDSEFSAADMKELNNWVINLREEFIVAEEEEAEEEEEEEAEADEEVEEVEEEEEEEEEPVAAAAPKKKGVKRRASSPSKDKQQRKNRKVTKKGVRSALTDHFNQQNPEKFSMTGKWTPEVDVSGFHSFAAARDAQLLRQVSAQFYAYVYTHYNNAEMEVEAMLADDRIVLASNQAITFDELYKAFLKSADANALLQTILTDQAGHDARGVSNAKKLSGILSGSRDLGVHAAIETIKAAILDAKPIAKVTSADPKFLTDAAYSNKILLITDLYGDLHAEQKLILLLFDADYTGNVTIRGKKRPCTACHAMLSFAAHLGYNIDMNPNPGGYWPNAGDGLYLLMDRAVKAGKITKEAADKWLANYLASFGNMHKSKTLDDDGDRTGADETVDYADSRAYAQDYDSPSDSEPETATTSAAAKGKGAKGGKKKGSKP